jgi:hypothetical protein
VTAAQRPTHLARRRSQAWFPGRYVPIRHIHGAEIFEQPRGGVRVDRTTLHGTAAEMRQLASQLLAAAHRLERREKPRPARPTAA